MLSAMSVSQDSTSELSLLFEIGQRMERSPDLRDIIDPIRSGIARILAQTNQPSRPNPGGAVPRDSAPDIP